MDAATPPMLATMTILPGSRVYQVLRRVARTSILALRGAPLAPLPVPRRPPP